MSLSSGQLPVRLTPLVGRETELNDIVQAVTRCRLAVMPARREHHGPFGIIGLFL
jgi:hypothetical protein